MNENIQSHCLNLENREKVSVSGVKNVVSFDDKSILLETVMGNLNIRGNDMQISSFDAQTGELQAGGHIGALYYTGEDRKGGFFSRMFK